MKSTKVKRNTVANIGTGIASEEQKIYNRYYRETMLKIGLIPDYINGSTYNSNKSKRLNKERFSTNYITRTEFEIDRQKIFGYLKEKRVAPEELVNKVAETIQELDLQFGE